MLILSPEVGVIVGVVVDSLPLEHLTAHVTRDKRGRGPQSFIEFSLQRDIGQQDNQFLE